MATELNNSLQQLESRRKELVSKADLTDEVASITELDSRLGLLLEEVKNLRENVDEDSTFVDSNCDKLGLSYRTLEKASQVFDVNSSLIELNRLCFRIDRIRVFNLPEQEYQQQPQQQQDRRLSSNPNDIDEMTVHEAKDVITKFENLYKPFESVFNERLDLPYSNYAARVRKVKSYLASYPVGLVNFYDYYNTT